MNVPAAWFALVSPVNPQRAATPPGSVPAGLEALRVRRESGHPAHGLEERRRR
ncbi:MAG: hypothetical protein ACREM3_08495 [Candidatus Rokuibacteriota bacterium]